MRQVLMVVIPLAIPFVAFGLYVLYARYRQAVGGPPPAWERPPVVMLLVAGLVLMVAGLVWFRLESAVPPGTKIEMPHMDAEGLEVVPAHRVE